MQRLYQVNHDIKLFSRDAKKYPFNKDIQKALHDLRLEKGEIIKQLRLLNEKANKI